MSDTIKIKTQKELDKHIKAGKRDFEFVAAGEFEIRLPEWIKVSVALALRFDVKIFARGSSRVTAWGSSVVEAWGSSVVEARGSSLVTAWGSSRVTARESSVVEARGSSRVTAWESSVVEARESSVVEARGSSRVTAWESSRVTAWESSVVEARESSVVEAWGSSVVTAWESSRVTAWGSSVVEASGFVSLSLWNKVTAKLSVKCHAFVHSADVKVTGGIQTKAILKTPKDWCEYYGIKTEKGLALVYKGLNDGYSSNHDHTFKYLPGTKPKSKKFDEQECSHGLHFSPHPRMTHQFVSSPKHYVACWIKISDMLVFFNGSYPGKCKAPEVMRPIIEVDVDGNELTVKQEKAA